MSDYTTDELIKANRVHADLHAGCQECPLYEERVCTSPKLQTYSADRLEAQQKEIAELKKQIAETYTVEQYLKDFSRLCEIGYAYGLENLSEKVREWAKSHPEKPKVTNGDKFREVFGIENDSHCYVGNGNTCPTARTTCELCEYGENAEYKEPSDK